MGVPVRKATNQILWHSRLIQCDSLEELEASGKHIRAVEFLFLYVLSSYFREKIHISAVVSSKTKLIACGSDTFSKPGQEDMFHNFGQHASKCNESIII